MMFSKERMDNLGKFFFFVLFSFDKFLGVGKYPDFFFFFFWKRVNVRFICLLRRPERDLSTVTVFDGNVSATFDFFMSFAVFMSFFFDLSSSGREIRKKGFRFCKDVFIIFLNGK